jgi:hypothetical protein
MRRHAGAWRTKVNALIAFYLSNAPLRANAAKGVTGYDLATLIWGGPGSPGDHPNYYDRADHHDRAHHHRADHHRAGNPLAVVGQQTGSGPSPTEVP